MAGYENIRDANSKRTPEERRELAKKAGQASGKARRRKANFQKTLNLLLTAEIDNEEWKPVLESLGVECTLESALLMAQIKAALDGDTQAAKFVAQYSGQSNRAEEDLENKKAETELIKARKEFLDNDELDIYLQRYTIFDNPFLPQEFVEQLCKEYEGTIYYDRLILGLWKRAEGAIYKRFADNPEKFRCEVLEGPADNPEHKQFRKNDIVSIEIGLDFGGNQSGHSFVARGYTDDYRDVIGIMSKRVMAKDQEKDIDSNMLDQLFCDFVQEVIDKYSVIKKQGDYVEYCNVESVYYDNAETVLGNSIRNAVEKRFPWMIVRKAKKASIIDRIRCTIRLMGAGRFWITEDCKSLQTALSDAVWNKDVKDKDERLDDGSTDIDSLDAFEYTIERDMRDLIEEVENV